MTITFYSSQFRLLCAETFWRRPDRPAARSVAGDSDNSLSMRWVKLGSTGAMSHAPGDGGGRVSWQMMRNHWDATRLLAADKARASGSEAEAKRIMQFQFHAIRPKAASEIADISEARASWALKRRDYGTGLPPCRSNRKAQSNGTLHFPAPNKKPRRP